MSERLRELREEFAAASTPLSGLVSARLLGRDIAASLVGLARRRARRAAAVAAEYDLGYWSDVRRDARWRRAATLDDFLVAHADGSRVCRVGSRLVRADSRAYYRFRVDMMAAALRECAGDVDELVEIGSGYGYNLFGLIRAGGWSRLRGFDVSEVGVSTARDIAAHYGLSGSVTFDTLDLTDAASPKWKELSGKTVFSYYCLEQLPRETERVMRNLIAAGVQRVIHIEPVAELMKWSSVKDWASYLYIQRSDYQRSILTTLRELERSGLVTVDRVDRLEYAPGVHHDPALICWKPAEK